MEYIDIEELKSHIEVVYNMRIKYQSYIDNLKDIIYTEIPINYDHSNYLTPTFISLEHILLDKDLNRLIFRFLAYYIGAVSQEIERYIMVDLSIPHDLLYSEKIDISPNGIQYVVYD